MEVRIRKDEWDGLSADSRKKVEAAIGSFFKGSTLTPDPKGVSGVELGTSSVGGLCEAGCNIAQAGAEAACQGISDPVAKALCLAAAKEAGDLCRSNC